MPRTVVTSAPRRVDMGTGTILTSASQWEDVDRMYNALVARSTHRPAMPVWTGRAPARVDFRAHPAESWKSARRHAYLAIRDAEGRLRERQRAELDELTQARFGLSVRALRARCYTKEEMAGSVMSSYLSIVVDTMRKRAEERARAAALRATQRESARAQKILVPWKGTPFQNRHLIIGQGRVMGQVRTSRWRSPLSQAEVQRYERLRAALINYWRSDPSRIPPAQGMRSWERCIITGRDITYLRERRQALHMPQIIHIPAPRELVS